MGVKVKINIDPNVILSKRHLENGGAAQLELVNEILKKAIPYTPEDSTTLETNIDIANGGKQIIYKSPYARYQYYGKVMAGDPRKPTDKDLVYNGAPMRGKEWIKRMWADRGKEITKTVADFVGGKSK